MIYEQLKLENQLCFPVYAASRLITREYQPYLDKLGLTYPQYLVLLILWETDDMPVNDIARKLILNTNTMTPLLKRMEQQGLVTRERSQDDERKVRVQLTQKGLQLREQASSVSLELVKRLSDSHLQLEDLIKLRDNLNALISFLTK
jgi:MarR family transcriptional regulator, organic hydroperoxide resistance regulator